jgi:hypothetical protein
MKSTVVRLTIFCMGLVFTSLVLAGRTHAQLDLKGAVAIWLFDEGRGDKVTDASGNGNDGEVVHDPKWVEGKFGEGLDFDGDADYVEINVPVVVETEDFTLGCWVNPGKSQKQWANILSSHNNDPQPPLNCRGMSIEQNSDAANQFYFIAGSAPGGCWVGQGVVTQLKHGEWQHFVVVRKDDKLTHYLNGEVTGEGAIPQELAVSTDNFRIANWSRGDKEHREFKGVVDEVFVFSRALSQDEITTAMKEGFAEILPVSPVDKALTTTWGTLKWANRRRGK